MGGKIVVGNLSNKNGTLMTQSFYPRWSLKESSSLTPAILGGMPAEKVLFHIYSLIHIVCKTCLGKPQLENIWE